MNRPKFSNVAAIVLAAGRGSRIRLSLPKPLLCFGKRTLLGHILEHLQAIPIAEKIAVVGYKRRLIEQQFGETWQYARQSRPQGNGQALKVGLSAVSKHITTVLILHADSAALMPASYLRSLILKHQRSKAILSVLTKPTHRFKGTGGIRTVGRRYINVESQHHPLAKDIKRINLGVYLVQASWLRQALRHLRLHPDTGEYMLSDILPLVPKGHVQIITLRNANYSLNINTRQDLRRARHIWRKQIKV